MGYYYGWLIPSANFFDLVKNTTEMLKKKVPHKTKDPKKNEFKFSLSIKPSAILFALSYFKENICSCNQSNEFKLHMAVSINTH